MTQETTPKATPFIITIPTSRPNENDMKHRAAKPAIVVTEEPMTDCSVALMAFAIAPFGSSGFSASFSLKLCHRKIE